MSGEAVEVIAHGWVVAAGAGAVVVVTLALLLASVLRRKGRGDDELIAAHAACAEAERGRADAEKARADSERGRREDALQFVDAMRGFAVEFARDVGKLTERQRDAYEAMQALTRRAEIVIAAGEHEAGIERRDNGTE